MIVLLFLSAFTVALLFFSWLLLFNIYEIKVSVNPKTIEIPNNKTEIRIIPLNSFGKEVLFRKVKAQFFIESGTELIDEFKISDDSSSAHIYVNGNDGIIELIVETNKNLFPTKIEIPITKQN